MLEGDTDPARPGTVDARAILIVTRHGYRIDVQGAKDSVSGLEYGRILNQMRGGEKEHTDRVSSLRLSWVTWFAQIAVTRKTYSLPARLVIVLAVLTVSVIYAVLTVIFHAGRPSSGGI